MAEGDGGEAEAEGAAEGASGGSSEWNMSSTPDSLNAECISCCASLARPCVQPSAGLRVTRFGRAGACTKSSAGERESTPV